MKDWNQYKAQRASHDRCRVMLFTAGLFYAGLFMLTMGATMAGVEIDTYTAVAIVFYVFPIGVTATLALTAIFELYAWVIE